MKVTHLTMLGSNQDANMEDVDFGVAVGLFLVLSCILVSVPEDRRQASRRTMQVKHSWL